MSDSGYHERQLRKLKLQEQVSKEYLKNHAAEMEVEDIILLAGTLEEAQNSIEYHTKELKKESKASDDELSQEQEVNA